MAAEEHQPELIVGHDVDEGVEVVQFRARVGFHVVRVESVGGDVAICAGRFPSESVDGTVTCGWPSSSG